MSRREFIGILLAAIVLTIAVPLVVQVFKPGQAGPEPLPGVPFSTEPSPYQPSANIPEEQAKEPMPTVVRGKVLIVDTETPVPATIEWHIERSNGGDISASKPAIIQADDKGCFAIVIPPVKTASRFLIWANASHWDFVPANSIGGWQDSGTESDIGVIQMRAFSRVTVAWKQQPEIDLTGEVLAFARISEALADAPAIVTARISSAGLATIRLGYGRWAMSLVLLPQRNVAKTLIPYAQEIEINAPRQEFNLEALCHSGTSTLIVRTLDGFGDLVASRIRVARVGPGEAVFGIGDGWTKLELTNLPGGIYEISAENQGSKLQRRVYLSEGQSLESPILAPVKPRLELQVLRKGKPVQGAEVSLTSEPHKLQTGEAGRVVVASNEPVQSLVIRLDGGGSQQDIICRRNLYGWGDRSVRVIELEPEGSVSLLVDARFRPSDTPVHSAVVSEWSQHLHLKALDPYSEVDEFRWANSVRGFRFIGLPRGKYLLEVRESALIDGQRKDLGPWSTTIELTDPSRDSFVVADRVPAFSFDCDVRFESLSTEDIYDCVVASFESDPIWGQRLKFIDSPKHGVLHVRDLPAGRWLLKANSMLAGKHETLYGTLDIDATGQAAPLVLSEVPPLFARRFNTGILHISGSFEASDKPRTDGLLTLHGLHGEPLKTWLTGTKFEFEFRGIQPGSYTLSFASRHCSWRSESFSMEEDRQTYVQGVIRLSAVRLVLELKNITRSQAAGAFLETSDGYQPECSLDDSEQRLTLEAHNVPFRPALFLCLGDGRRIALELGQPPSVYERRFLTIDLK